MFFSIQSKTVHDLFKVLSGNVIAQGLGFATTVIVSRDLGVEQYGVFSLLLAIFVMLVQLSDFGISTAYVKYLSGNLSKEKEIFFAVFLSKAVLSAVVMLVMFWFSNDISFFFFHTSLYGDILRCISVAIVFHATYALVVSHYQAKQYFKQFAWIGILHNALKLLSVGVVSLLFVHKNHVEYFLYAYAYAVVIVWSLIVTARGNTIAGKTGFDFAHIKTIYKLGFWIFLSSIATMIMLRLDVMMLTKMSTSQEAGYYSAAMNLAMIIPLITASLTTTLLPKMHTFLKENSIKSYIVKIVSKTKLIIAILLMFELLAPYGVGMIFGNEYVSSISVFRILIIAFLFGLIVNPISLVFYSIDKAYLLTVLNWFQVPLNYFGNILLIPHFQADGAALSTVLVKIVSGIFIVVYFLRSKN